MFKTLIKKLEDENALNTLANNGSVLRDTIRDASQAVMKQVKDKVNEAQNSFNSPSTSSPAGVSTSPSLPLIGASSSQPLVDISPAPSTSTGDSTSDEQIDSLKSKLMLVTREREALLSSNSRLCDLMQELKKELAEERNMRKSMEREYNRPNEDIAFKVLIHKEIQTEPEAASPPCPQTIAPGESDAQPATTETNESFCQTESSSDHENDIDMEQVKRDRKQLDELVLRNAELSHLIEKFRQQANEELNERNDMQAELDTLKKEKASLAEAKESLRLQLSEQREARLKEKENDTSIPLGDHRAALAKLEEQLADKNKTIKLQQQRILDIKKSIQRGDLPLNPSVNAIANNQQTANNHGYWSDDSSTDGLAALGLHAKALASGNDINRSKSPPAIIDISLANNADGESSTGSTQFDSSHHSHIVNTLDTNFEYLKNVVYKFLTCKDYESQKHVVKAISVLLKFSAQEEEEIKDILDWRASWYSAIPIVGSLTASHHSPAIKNVPSNTSNLRRGS